MYTIPIISGIIGIVFLLLIWHSSSIFIPLLAFIPAFCLGFSIEPSFDIHHIQQTNCTRQIRYYTNAKGNIKEHQIKQFHRLNRKRMNIYNNNVCKDKSHIRKYNNNIHVYKQERAYKENPILRNYISLILRNNIEK